jgi:hypothetical protein
MSAAVGPVRNDVNDRRIKRLHCHGARRRERMRQCGAGRSILCDVHRLTWCLHAVAHLVSYVAGITI